LKQLHVWSTNRLSEKIYKLSENKTAIVYCAEERCVQDDFDFSKIKSPEKLEFVLGGTDYYGNFYNEYKKYSTVHFWSNFFLYQAVREIDLSRLNSSANKNLFVSLNHNGHLHRCKLIDCLAKYDLLKSNIFSWHSVEVSPNFLWSYWKPKKVILDKTFLKNKSQHLIPKEFDYAFLNLVPESETDVIFVTEKTYHAILAAKPFISLAAPRFHEFLQSRGFKLYDEIISYDFDTEENIDARIEMIIEQLLNLKDKNYNELYDIVKPKLDYNKKRALEIVRNQEGIPEIARNFKYYDNIIKEAICKLDTLE